MNDQDLRLWLQRSFDINPKDLSKYRMALTMVQCQVLELFGDSVLGFVVSEYLVNKYPVDEPGWFTHVRSAIVENKNLTRIANQLNIASVIIIPSTSTRHQITDKVKADMLEALIAAIYLDLGTRKCQEFIYKVFDLENQVLKVITPENQKHISNPQKARQQLEERVKEDIINSLNNRNAISALQEFLAKKGETLPEYTEIGRTGTPHQLVFTIEATCRFRGRCLVAEGTGNNLREARQNAAHNLLTKVIEMYRNSWSALEKT